MLFEGRYLRPTPHSLTTTSLPMDRFLMVRDDGAAALKPTHMILVQNWFEELKPRVPTK